VPGTSPRMAGVTLRVTHTWRCYGTDNDFGGRTHRRRNREAACARAGSWRVDRHDLVGYCGCVGGNVARPDAGFVLERSGRGLDCIDHRRRAAATGVPRHCRPETLAAALSGIHTLKGAPCNAQGPTLQSVDTLIESRFAAKLPHPAAKTP